MFGALLASFGHGGKEKKIRDILREFLESPRLRAADIDEETSERYAIIINYLWEQGTPILTNDLWSAAIATQYGFALLTTDGHYRNVPLVIVECFPREGSVRPGNGKAKKCTSSA